MPKPRKKKSVKKPNYTKLNGYIHVNDIVRKIPGHLNGAANIVLAFVNIDQSLMTTGEILKSKEAITTIKDHAEEIKNAFDKLKDGFEALCARPGKKTDDDFSDLVFESMELISKLTDNVIIPVVSLTEIVERINKHSGEDHV